jgi:hypothetical protein
MQNEIIKITSSVLSNPDPKVQSKILKTLNTDFAEQQADFIESLTAQQIINSGLLLVMNTRNKKCS